MTEHAIATNAAALRALDDALRLIDRGGCERLTRGRCYDAGNGWVRGGQYYADAWCSPCVAAHALAEVGLS